MEPTPPQVDEVHRWLTDLPTAAMLELFRFASDEKSSRERGQRVGFLNENRPGQDALIAKGIIEDSPSPASDGTVRRWRRLTDKGLRVAQVLLHEAPQLEGFVAW